MNVVNLRTAIAPAVAALALAIAPAAQADPDYSDTGWTVCNTASQNWQGPDYDNIVSPMDPQGALRYDDELKAKKDEGEGLVNAAMHSRALAVCAEGYAGEGANY
ncbi:MAG TPA: hypothetical protein VGJ32_06870 [Solirubrobacteraceae bacterium]